MAEAVKFIAIEVKCNPDAAGVFLKRHLRFLYLKIEVVELTYLLYNPSGVATPHHLPLHRGG